MNSSWMNVLELTQTVGGTLVQEGPSVPLVGVTTDSRSVKPGQIFVALEGERFDGHAFVADVVRKGAAVVLVSRSRARAVVGATGPACSVIGVDDTLVALGAIASARRQAWQGKAIAITGSAGKTTTKELVSAALSTSGSVLMTPGNWNNRIGLPLTLFQLAEEDFGVLELGTSEKGEIEVLAEIADPDVALITNVGAAHLEGLGSIDGVMEEKGALLRALEGNDTAVINLDDPRIRAFAENLAVESITYGSDPIADVQVVRVRPLEAGRVEVELRIEGQHQRVQLAGIGQHMGTNAAAAIAASMALGVPAQKALEGIQSFEPPSNRLGYRVLADVHVVDDSYNSNPRSATVALQSFGELGDGGERRFAILGDMLELGEQAESHHQDLGRVAAQEELSGIIAVGNHSNALVAAAREAGTAAKTWAVEDAQAASRIVLDQIQPGDWVLVKGSRGIRLEQVIQALEAGRK